MIATSLWITCMTLSSIATLERTLVIIVDETRAEILIFGSGNFAGRMALDLAATAAHGVTVAIAGRNTERLTWLETAGNARAAMFGRPARLMTRRVDLSVADAAA